MRTLDSLHAFSSTPNSEARVKVPRRELGLKDLLPFFPESRWAGTTIFFVQAMAGNVKRGTGSAGDEDLSAFNLCFNAEARGGRFLACALLYARVTELASRSAGKELARKRG